MKSPETETPEAARFAIEQFAPEVQAAFRELAEKKITFIRTSLTPDVIANFFQAPTGAITSTHIDAFMRFVEAAMLPLVLGAYCGPNYDIRFVRGKPNPPDQQIDAIKKEGSGLLNEPWHEIVHAITAVGRSSDPRASHAVIPAYLKVLNHENAYSHEPEKWREVAPILESEEVLSELFEYRKDLRATYIGLIRDARAKHQGDAVQAENAFMRAVVARSTRPQTNLDDFAKKILRRVFHQYEKNPMLMFDLFTEMTASYVEERAREQKRTDKKVT